MPYKPEAMTPARQQQILDRMFSPAPAGSAGFGNCEHCGTITRAVWRRRVSIFALIVLIGGWPLWQWIVILGFSINVPVGIISLILLYMGLHWKKDKACSKCKRYYSDWFGSLYQK